MKTLNWKQTGILTLALGAAVTSATLTGAANAQSGFDENTPRLMLNGRPFETRVAPVVQDGRVLVPLRDIFENLGARVNYNDFDRTITARRDGTRVQMRLGASRAQVDGRPVRLDVPALSVNGATMVPLRFVSEALGATVNFSQRRNVVRINDGNFARNERGQEGRGRFENNRPYGGRL